MDRSAVKTGNRPRVNLSQLDEKIVRPGLIFLFAALISAQIYGFSTITGKCAHRLRSLDVAKETVAEKEGLKTGDLITWDDVRAYYDYALSKCPKGGAYTIGAIGTRASCSFSNHTWAEWEKQLAIHKRETAIHQVVSLAASVGIVVGSILGGFFIWRRFQRRIKKLSGAQIVS